MTLRKPLGKGERAEAFSFPLRTHSQLPASTQVSREEVSGESAITISYNSCSGGTDTPLKERRDAEWPSSEGSGGASDGFHSRGRQMSAEAPFGTDASPPSPQIFSSIGTPGSSFEDARLGRVTSPSLHDANQWHQRHPASIRSTSSNPFRRNDEKIPIEQILPATETASANVWADEANEQRIGSSTKADETIYTAFSQPTQDGHGYSPVCATPFDDPYIGSTATAKLPQPQQHAPVNSEEAHSASTAFYPPAPQPNSLQGLERFSQENGVTDPRSDEKLLNNNSDKILPPLPSRWEEPPPSLPLRAGESPPPLPARATTQQHASSANRSLIPHVDTSVNKSATEPGQIQPELGHSRNKSQRSETYQIRLVNWYDASGNINRRRSPIMVQNANGPCPLLALVNALVLSTPAGISTILVDTLERREQVSLGLLLDIVIDELMSGRRGNAAQNLPDVSELYTFLINLHTGMNVNPRFIPPEPQQPNLMDAPIEEFSYDTTSHTRFAGAFEDTKEMKLYSTFAVPLIHGWIPSRTHPAFAALGRSAKTYEDAQNLLFEEEELEEKLRQQGLTQNEQLLLEDIASIKYFLSSSATQLTGYGLDSINESLNPGQIVILFRNDHFSTLYRHPRSGQLFSLVTDMGYAGHDEVVWESLIDVSGEGSEFFSGDFRPVGNNNPTSTQSAAGAGCGWTTVSRSEGARMPQNQPSGHVSGNTAPTDQGSAIQSFSNLSIHGGQPNPKSPTTEQEDHDLALALQLQEEEEEKERQEIAARKREDELSKAFLESQPSSRGRGATKGSNSRPAVTTRNDARTGPARVGRQNQAGSPASIPNRLQATGSDVGDDAPPPSYEQAANGPAYNPPSGHPSHTNASNSGMCNTPRPQGRQRHSSAYSENSTALAGSPLGTNPGGSPYTNTPSQAAQSRRRSGGVRPLPARGGLGGVEGAPGVYRRDGNPGPTPAEANKNKSDCTLM